MTTSIKRTGRCLCGLRVALHYDASNRKLSCEQARAEHPHAVEKPASLLAQFARIGAVKE